jgi:hypothetical protein
LFRIEQPGACRSDIVVVSSANRTPSFTHGGDTGTVNVDILACSTRMNVLEVLENLKWALRSRGVQGGFAALGTRPANTTSSRRGAHSAEGETFIG